MPPRDVARAKQLLKDAGVDHLTIGLRTLNTPSDQQIGEIIQSMAAEAGIDVKVMPGETNANIQAYLHGDFQAGLVIWSGRSDPDFNIAQYLVVRRVPGLGQVLRSEIPKSARQGPCDDRSARSDTICIISSRPSI